MMKVFAFLGVIITVIVPLLMVGWGVHLRKDPPEYQKGRLSFRTKLARQDEEIWVFANSLFAHMVMVIGINVGLVSVVFYIGALVLAGGSYWPAVSVSLLAVQAVCVFFVYRITDFIVKKTYRKDDEEEDDDADKDSEDDSSNDGVDSADGDDRREGATQ